MASFMPTVRNIGAVFRRLLHHLGRPIRQSEGAEGLSIEVFRGYGNRRELYLVGRVYRHSGAAHAASGRRRSHYGDLRASLARLLRRGAAGQTVTARCAGAEQHLVTDGDGYFRAQLSVPRPLPAQAHWQRVTLQLRLPSGSSVLATGEVFVPGESSRFVVISDIDDTVMETGVANKALMIWRLFAEAAESRTAFPGVAALYRALHGHEENPLLYVSRGPWSLYPTLEEFFHAHRIPVGPVLFLREWGVSPRHPLPRRSAGHKLALIRRMLDVYRDLPFVLIGDSGQHDPETYARVVREHPGRVSAIYIRNVSVADRDRAEAIDALAREVVDAGSRLLLAADSITIAEDAAAVGLVPADTPRRVAESLSSASREQPSRRRRAPGHRGIRRVRNRGELEQSLQDDPDNRPSTLVKSPDDRPRP